MATVALLGSSYTTAAGSKSVTATPTVNDLIIIIAAGSNASGSPSGVGTLPTDNQGGTYTSIVVAQSDAVQNQVGLFVRNSLISSAVSTVFTDALDSGNSGGGLMVLRVSGMTRTGAAAIKRSAKQDGGTSGSTPAPVLSAAPASTNPIIGAVMANLNTGNVITPRTGYTEHGELTYATPVRTLEVISLDSGETSATITWGGTVGAAFGALAAELDTASTTTFNQTISASASSSPTVARSAAKPVTIANGAATTAARSSSKTIAPTAVAAVSSSRNAGKTITVAGATATGLTTARAFTRTLSASAGSVVSFAKATAHIFSAAQGSAISLARAVGKIITASSTASSSSSMVKARGQVISASAAAAVTRTIAMAHAIGVSGSSSLSLVRQSTFIRTISAAVSGTATVGRQAVKDISVTVGAAVALSRPVGKRIAVSSATIVTMAVSRPLTAVINAIATTVAVIGPKWLGIVTWRRIGGGAEGSRRGIVPHDSAVGSSGRTSRTGIAGNGSRHGQSGSGSRSGPE